MCAKYVFTINRENSVDFLLRTTIVNYVIHNTFDSKQEWSLEIRQKIDLCQIIQFYSSQISVAYVTAQSIFHLVIVLLKLDLLQRRIITLIPSRWLFMKRIAFGGVLMFIMTVHDLCASNGTQRRGNSRMLNVCWTCNIFASE